MICFDFRLLKNSILICKFQCVTLYFYQILLRVHFISILFYCEYLRLSWSFYVCIALNKILHLYNTERGNLKCLILKNQFEYFASRSIDIWESSFFPCFLFNLSLRLKIARLSLCRNKLLSFFILNLKIWKMLLCHMIFQFSTMCIGLATSRT